MEIAQPQTPAQPPSPTLPTSQPETFSREYVEELRAENKSIRIKREAVRTQLAEAQKRIESFESETQTKLNAKQAEMEEKLLHAELRSIALKAGIVDLDGLKLADVSGLKLLDDGTGIEGADTFISQLKEAKPYLFGMPKNTSSTSTPPTQQPAPAKSALDMTPEEYKAAKAAMLRSQGR